MADQHPAVAHLLAAHQRAEEAALATTPVPLAGRWAVVRDKHADRDALLTLVQGRDPIEPDSQDYGYGVPVIVLAADWQDEAEANLRHVALHDPASVLLRVAEERNLLAEHGDDYGSCKACGRASEETNSRGYAFFEPGDWPCRTVLGLARAWGWVDVSGS